MTGRSLDVAEDALDGLGLRYRTAGGGMFGIVVRSNWIVCAQDPPPRTVATSVLLTVARSCEVPDLVGLSLDDAEEALDDAGVSARVHYLDGEGVIGGWLWTVCGQRPAGGMAGRVVDLYVSQLCCGWCES